MNNFRMKKLTKQIKSIFNQENKNPEHQYNLMNFLKIREFKNNINNDFSINTIIPFQKIDESNNYSFQLGEQTIEFGKISDDGTSGKINDEKYSIISVSKPKSIGLSAIGLVIEEYNNILILPFFWNIIFYRELNIFICMTISDKIEDREKYFYNHFYFDIKGRYIRTEKGYHNQQLPRLAFLNNTKQELIEIEPLNDGFQLSKIVSYNLFIIYNTSRKLGIVDNGANLILECDFECIEINESLNVAIIQNKEGVFKFNLITKQKNRLPFTTFVDVKDGYFRLKNNNKWGVIDSNGKIILEANFDYLELNYTKNRFKIFNGHYDWTWEETVENELEKHTQSHLFNIDDYCGELKNGKWSIIDGNEQVIIQADYDWIEELTESLYILNQGGKLHQFYNDEKEEEDLIVIGGKWTVCNKNGQFLNEFQDLDILENTSELTIKNTNEFNKNSDFKAFKIK